MAVFRKAKNVFLSKTETPGWPILSRTWEMFMGKRIWSTIKMVRLLGGAVGVMEKHGKNPQKLVYNKLRFFANHLQLELYPKFGWLVLYVAKAYAKKNTILGLS